MIENINNQPTQNLNDSDHQVIKPSTRAKRNLKKLKSEEPVNKAPNNKRHADILDKYNPENITNEDIDHVLKKVKATGFSITGLFLNIEV